MSNIPQGDLAGHCAECERVQRATTRGLTISSCCQERENTLRLRIKDAEAAILAMIDGLPSDICAPPPTIKYLSTYVNRA